MNGHGSSGTLGTIEWEITESPSGKTIHHGKRDIGRDDIEVVEVVPLLDRIRRVRSDAPLGGKIMLGVISAVPRVAGAVMELVTGGNRSLYRKRIHLGGDFCFDLVDRPSARRETLAGFGLVAERGATPTFSWEWFEVGDEQERATKLQEEGELGIRLERATSGDWEVGYTEFLTDVSLRMEPREGAGRRDFGPGWRVRIVEGSHVSWPSADEVSGSVPPQTSP